MAIPSLDEDRFIAILDEYVRPSSPIDSFEHLYGRDKQLQTIDEALSTRGRHVFIYGDRGVGKTSLARTAAFKRNPSAFEPPFVACGTGTGFASLVSSIVTQLNRGLGIKEQKRSERNALDARIFKHEEVIESTEGRIPEILDANAAVEAIRTVVSACEAKPIAVVDEFENLRSDEDQRLFAELIKQISDQAVPITFIFCGIGTSLDELLTAHASCHRYLEGISLPRLDFSGRWEIIDKSAEALEISVNPDSRFRIAAISDGFPHYVHLVCHKLFWTVFRDTRLCGEALPEHYVVAVHDAVQSVEAHLRQAYETATMKDNDDYQEVLWALADHYELKRNARRIYDESYLRIMAVRRREPLEWRRFQSRLSNLKSERHGAIIRSDRRSWVEFSESMVRGYVRLRAEEQGVRLALEHESGPKPQLMVAAR